MSWSVTRWCDNNHGCVAWRSSGRLVRCYYEGPQWARLLCERCDHLTDLRSPLNIVYRSKDYSLGHFTQSYRPWYGLFSDLIQWQWSSASDIVHFWGNSLVSAPCAAPNKLESPAVQCTNMRCSNASSLIIKEENNKLPDYSIEVWASRSQEEGLIGQSWECLLHTRSDVIHSHHHHSLGGDDVMDVPLMQTPR